MADQAAPEGGIDPGVTIPDGVKAASAAADQAYQAAYPSQVPVEGGTPASAPEPTPEPTPEPPLESQDEGWERRYKAMKGRYDTLSSENRNLAGRLGSLEQTLAKVTLPSSNGTHDPKNDPTLDQITPQEVSDYGEEFLKIVEKQAKQALMPHISKLEQENSQLKAQLSQVGQHVTQDAKSKLEGYLDNNLKTWRDLNHNEEFLGWLAQPDSYSGAKRHDLLKQAYERNDSQRVLAFFNGFLADEAAVAPRSSGATNGNGNYSQPKVPLEKFAAPGRARTAAQSPAEKPVITRGQISAFYAQVSAGAYSGNEAEKVRLENMIFEAQRDGRIT